MATLYKLSGSQTDEAPDSHPRSAPTPRGHSQVPRSPEGRAPLQSGQGQCGHQALVTEPKAPRGPRWSLKAAVMNPSKATSEDPRARRAWCAFQLGVGETRPGLPACWGPTPAAPADFWVGLTLHGADGRFQHPVLGPRGPSRGLCAVGTPGEEAPAALQKEGPCSPCVASTAGSVFPPLRRRMLPVLHPDRPGAASMSRRTAEEHMDPGTGQAMWAGQLPDEGRAGVLCVCDTHLPVHASLPGPTSDAALGPVTASPTGAHVSLLRPVPQDAGVGTGWNLCVQEPLRTQVQDSCHGPLGSWPHPLLSARGPESMLGGAPPGLPLLCSRARPSGSRAPGHGLCDGGCRR